MRIKNKLSLILRIKMIVRRFATCIKYQMLHRTCSYEFIFKKILKV